MSSSISCQPCDPACAACYAGGPNSCLLCNSGVSCNITDPSTSSTLTGTPTAAISPSPSPTPSTSPSFQFPSASPSLLSSRSSSPSPSTVVSLSRSLTSSPTPSVGASIAAGVVVQSATPVIVTESSNSFTVAVSVAVSTSAALVIVLSVIVYWKCRSRDSVSSHEPLPSPTGSTFRHDQPSAGGHVTRYSPQQQSPHAVRGVQTVVNAGTALVTVPYPVVALLFVAFLVFVCIVLHVVSPGLSLLWYTLLCVIPSLSVEAGKRRWVRDTLQPTAAVAACGTWRPDRVEFRRCVCRRAVFGHRLALRGLPCLCFTVTVAVVGLLG